MGQEPKLKYHIWTMGCQMNKADSDRLCGGLEKLGLEACDSYEAADCIIVNTCVVRQQAYDTAAGMIGRLSGIKEAAPDKFLAVMGCMVGSTTAQLSRTFPLVDVWAKPQDFAPILERVALKAGADAEGCLSGLTPVTPKLTAYIPVVHGCNKFCTFCIIPYRRGRETSRPVAELVREVELISRRGVREVTLLGQNVDSYGQDLQPRRDLADLMEALHRIEGIERIRFLTSHPNDMSSKIIAAIRDLPKVCESVNLPFQAGANRTLANMRRGYTREQYLEKIAEVRAMLPGATLSTDVIVGFPGETEGEFEQTLDILERVRFHKVHSFTYSVRPQSYAFRLMEDDVPLPEKKRRLGLLNDLQKRIQTEDNRKAVGSCLDVLLDDYNDGKVSGRTRGDKLVHIAAKDGRRHIGETLSVKIIDSTPWSFRGELAHRSAGAVAV